ncbi:hypothetical protein DFA_00769 [Cavenderia fasciculata]|uniref:Tetratricopeptide-like helical domain-containing protein n=1 Tax=Cavenderia fasciculata TaxID=261658 RepID=F4PTS3_CACFS|nr:uncharacterized protein DFA_00769 [Cavenderia fasciculata]EGG20902.1 hypothetical protein DFA_00769 [Cavenderia fasciculata]|eukprot:XP_004358752.1 hypothetical protein DFA_00769 [Cavenderia fasciculata]
MFRLNNFIRYNSSCSIRGFFTHSSITTITTTRCTLKLSTTSNSTINTTTTSYFGQINNNNSLITTSSKIIVAREYSSSSKSKLPIKDEFEDQDDYGIDTIGLTSPSLKEACDLIDQVRNGMDDITPETMEDAHQDIDKAFDLLESAIEKDEDGAAEDAVGLLLEANLVKAMLLQGEGKQEAIHFYENTVALLDQYGEPYEGFRDECVLGKAVCHLDLGQLQEAGQTVDILLKEDPNNVSALVIKGRVTGDIRYLEKAGQIDPTDIQTPLTAGHLYEIKGNKAKAAECYDKAIDLHTADSDPNPMLAACHWLTTYHLALKNYNAVYQVNQRANKLYSCAPLLKSMADAKYFLGDYNSSLDLVNQAIKLNPEDIQDYELLKGQISIKLGLANQEPNGVLANYLEKTLQGLNKAIIESKPRFIVGKNESLVQLVNDSKSMDLQFEEIRKLSQQWEQFFKTQSPEQTKQLSAAMDHISSSVQLINQFKQLAIKEGNQSTTNNQEFNQLLISCRNIINNLPKYIKFT